MRSCTSINLLQIYMRLTPLVRCFPDHDHIHESLYSLLQAYISMVPDVTYNRGLIAMAGQLLLQSPEEDAFWTFVALMDNRLRGYFAPVPVSLEVDTSLFVKAAEFADPAFAKKVFVSHHLAFMTRTQI